MNAGPSLANRYAFIGAPFLLGAMIWLAVGVPYNMVWLLVLMLAVGEFFAWRAKKLQEQETRERGDAYLKRLKEDPPK